MLLCSVFCALLVILSLLLVIMGGQHDGLLLSGSPPIRYIYIHMYIFLMANKLCCCCYQAVRVFFQIVVVIVVDEQEGFVNEKRGVSNIFPGPNL